MPIRAELTPNSPIVIADIVSLIDVITTELPLVSGTSVQARLAGRAGGFDITADLVGLRFGYGTADNERFLASGTVNSIDVVVDDLSPLRFRDVDIDMATFAPIIQEDLLGIDPFGIERFLMSQDWHFELSNFDDIAPRGTIVGDGIALDLRGDDIFLTRGGDDDVYGGAGDDEMRGGDGDDRLDGGVGSDLLFGDDGADVLFGGAGADFLSGGGGDDVMYGDGA